VKADIRRNICSGKDTAIHPEDRSARTGSIRAARYAGMTVAASATAVSTTAAPAT
jgi:hypothetical protein